MNRNVFMSGVVAVILIGFGNVPLAHSQTKQGLAFQPQTFQIISGPGAGSIVETVDSQGDTSNWNQDQGFLDTQGPGCSCSHYHGELGGLPDPAPDNCGWGCVQPLSQSFDQLFNTALSMANNLADPDLRNSVLFDLSLIPMAASNNDFCVFNCALGCALNDLDGALAHSNVPPTQVSSFFDVFVELDVLGSGLSPLVNAVAVPPIVFKKPLCGVSIVQRVSSGKKAKLVPPHKGGKIQADSNEVISLVAIGVAPGGTYEWPAPTFASLPPGTGFAASGDRASFVAEHSLKKPIAVTVIYHCPDGGTATATVLISVP